MRRTLGFLIVILIVSTASVFAGTKVKLVDALIQVESKGNLDAIGDGGKAIGCLQIHKEVIDDVNKHYPNYYREKLYTVDDAFCKDKAIEICWLYLKYWGNQYKRKHNKIPTKEVYVRIWNGGPTGYEKQSTIKYWNKVKKILQ